MPARKIIEKLKALGFRDYEARAFLVMLDGEAMTATEIAKKSKVIRNSIYDVMRFFVDKGFVNEIETNTILYYQLVDPRYIMDKIEKEYNDKYRNSIMNLKETFGEIETVYDQKSKKENPEINIELIRGFNMHRVAKYIELLGKSKREVCGMYRLKGLVSTELDAEASNFLDKGGIIKSIYKAGLDFKIKREGKASTAKPEDFIKVLQIFESNGEKLRISHSEIPNMTIFDRETVYVHLQDKDIPKHRQADIIIKNKHYAENMCVLFDYLWNEGDSITEFIKNKSTNLKLLSI